MSLLEQSTIKKGQGDKTFQLELDESNSEEYKVEAIWDSGVYAKESDSGHLSGFYYLVLWKSYPEEENIWEPTLMVLHLHKIINTFHHDYTDQLTATSPPIESATTMAIPTAKPRAEA